MELNREHFRAMIFYDFKSGLTFHQCHERLSAAFPNLAPSIATVTGWFREFKRGRDSLEDEGRTGRPVSVTTPETVDRVRRMVEADRRVTYQTIEACLGISSPTVASILRDHLAVRKLTSRWVPHLLTAEQKQARMSWCQEMLERFGGGASKSVTDIVTCDETWVYCYEPERKCQSRVWTFEDEAPPTKVVRGRSTGKQMVATFFRKTGHIATVALESQRTVTADWYCTVCLPQVISSLEGARPKCGVRGLWLHQDNASAHTANRTREFLQTVGFQQLSHPPYSPDLAPCDFFLFPSIKNSMRGCRFSSAEEAVDAYRSAVEGVSHSEWRHCFATWFERMRRCIKADGEYFEKL